MIRTSGLPACLALALLGSAGASAQEELLAEPPGGEVSFSATQTQVAEVRVDNANGRDDDDNYGVVIDRLNLRASTRGFTAFARIDGFGFLLPPSDLYRSQVRLERVGANYSLGGVSITLGDFYEQLGRGLSLSMRKLPEAGVDVSIFGARLAWVGEKNSLMAFVGRSNAANLDSVNQRAVDDRHDLLASGLYEMTPAGSTRIAFYGLYNQPEESVLPDRFQDLSFSAGSYLDTGNLVEWWNGYLEVALQQRFIAGNSQLGSAVYSTHAFRAWALALNIETMMLNAYEQKGSRNSALGSRFDYNRPPTLERLDQEVINNRDVLGLRLRPELFIDAAGTLLYANLMVRANDWLEERRLIQVHGYAGFELSYSAGQSRLAGALGYRHEQLFTQPEPLKTAALVDVDWLHALGGGWATHLSTQTQFRTFEGLLYFWGSSFAGLEKTGLGGVTFELGYNSLDPSPGIRRIFYALIGQWEVSRRLTLRGTVGNQRGGLKCVAGICREWPAFSGAQIVAITRF